MCVVLIVPIDVADRDVEQNGAIVKARLYRTPRRLDVNVLSVDSRGTAIRDVRSSVFMHDPEKIWTR